MRKVFLFVLLLGLLGQCSFPLEDENHVQISSMPKASVGINISMLADTTYLLQPLKVDYKLSLSGHPSIAIFVALGEDLYYLGYEPEGWFVLQDHDHQVPHSGFLSMQFVVLSTTETKSLADLNQRELQLFSVTKILAYNVAEPPPPPPPPPPPTPPPFPAAPAFNSVTVDAGNILVQWTPITDNRLTGYFLSKSYYANPLDTSPTSIETIAIARDANSYRDQDFIAGKMEYRIAPIHSGTVESNGPPSSITIATPELTGWSPLTGNSVAIRWGLGDLYSNIDRYHLVGHGIAFYGTATSSPWTATLANFPFGTPVPVTLKSEGAERYNVTSSSFRDVYIGKRVFAKGRLIPDPANGQMFVLDFPNVIRIRDEVRDSVALPITNGWHYLTGDGKTLYVAQGEQFFRITTDDLQVEAFSIPEESWFTYVVTDNSIVLSVPDSGNESTTLRVYDLQTKLLVQSLPLTEAADGPSTFYLSMLRRIEGSPYILGTGIGLKIGVFELSGNGTITASRYLPGYFALTNKSRSKLYLTTYTETTAYSLPSFSQQSVSVLPNGGTFIVDLNGETYGTTSGTTFTAYDPETRVELAKVNLTDDADWAYLTLANGMLYHRDDRTHHQYYIPLGF